MIESDAKLPPLKTALPQKIKATPQSTPTGKRKAKKAVQQIRKRIIYKCAKEVELDWYGWTVLPAQHSKFMAPNETFVIFSQSDNEMHHFLY